MNQVSKQQFLDALESASYATNSGTLASDLRTVCEPPFRMYRLGSKSFGKVVYDYNAKTGEKETTYWLVNESQQPVTIRSE